MKIFFMEDTVLLGNGYGANMCLEWHEVGILKGWNLGGKALGFVHLLNDVVCLFGSMDFILE